MIGFSDEELRDLLADADEVNQGLTDEDAAPEAPECLVSRTGDVWVMGNHRVLCGDATDLDVVKQLMAGEQADMVFTDPPYNLDYEGYTEAKLKIQNDRMAPEEFNRFLRDAFTSYRAAVKPGARTSYGPKYEPAEIGMIGSTQFI